MKNIVDVIVKIILATLFFLFLTIATITISPNSKGKLLRHKAVAIAVVICILGKDFPFVYQSNRDLTSS